MLFIISLFRNLYDLFLYLKELVHELVLDLLICSYNCVLYGLISLDHSVFDCLIGSYYFFFDLACL